MHFNRMCGVTSSVQSRGARARVELGGWLEPALSAVTAPSQVLSQSGGLSCITGSEWLRAQAAFRTAGWAAGSQPSELQWCGLSPVPAGRTGPGCHCPGEETRPRLQQQGPKRPRLSAGLLAVLDSSVVMVVVTMAVMVVVVTVVVLPR